MTLQGKRVVLLGGTSGIGLATARAAAKAGATLVVASSSQARVDAALQQLPAGTTGHAVDLTQEQSFRDLFEKVGAFDHLTFTAGENLQLSTIAGSDVAAARRFFELRYWGAFMAAKYGSGRIRAGGSIVFTGGSAFARPQSGWAVAASICGAMEGLTRALAVELAPIRVNLVAPGVVRTELWGGMSEADREGLFRAFGAKLLVGRVGQADEIGDAYVYLMSNGFMTGQVVDIDGGSSLV